MSSIKEYQRKIASIKSTRKITGSMKMISSIKLQKTGKILDASIRFRKIARQFENTMLSFGKSSKSPLIEGYKQVRHINILLITSDRGLCGRFNMNTIRKMLNLIIDLEKKECSVTISCVGTRGLTYLKRRTLAHKYYDGILSHTEWNKTKIVADELFEEFMTGKSQEVWVVYSKRISSLSEEPVAEQILPFNRANSAVQETIDYIIEEPAEKFIIEAARLLIESRVYEAVIESAVAEHAARMSAMDSASTNCDRLISKFIQLRNRARQAAITTELNEIVTGKEALES